MVPSPQKHPLSYTEIFYTSKMLKYFINTIEN